MATELKRVPFLQDKHIYITMFIIVYFVYSFKPFELIFFLQSFYSTKTKNIQILLEQATIVTKDKDCVNCSVFSYLISTSHV